MPLTNSGYVGQGDEVGLDTVLTIANRVRARTWQGHDRGPGKRPRWLVERAVVAAQLQQRSVADTDLRRRIDELTEETPG